MHILAINFDLNWFLTIPGMLITGGILLLLIALIIFIATSGSSKKNKKKEVSDLVSPSPESINPNTTTAPVENSVPVSPVVEPIAPQPVPMATNQQVVSEVVSPVVETPVVPEAVVPEPTVTIQPTEPVQPVQEAPTDNSPNFIPPVTEMPSPVTPTVESTQVPGAEGVSIYGGVSPVVPNVQPVEQPRQIYGGANPLDKTQAIPVIQPNQHMEYGVPVENQPAPVETPVNQGINDITNVQPVEVTPEQPAPEVAPQQEIPTAPVTESAPVVEVATQPETQAEPVVEPAANVNEPSTQEVAKEHPAQEEEIEVLDF